MLYSGSRSGGGFGFRGCCPARFRFVVLDEKNDSAVLVPVCDGIVRGDGFELAIAYSGEP